MATLFYSWQSDTPSKTNRNFIRNALDWAVKRTAKGVDVEEALRIDQDTQGVPGNPEIANTILRKIDGCDIFVPDLTFVAKTADGKPVPNPNVLIELGYAMKSKGDAQFIFVMNEAFGRAEEGLPFDLQHKRWPLRYTLSEDASPETRRQVREQLAKNFTEAIRTILDSGVLRSEPETPPFQEVSPVWKSSTFLHDGEQLASRGTGEKALKIVWHNGPQAFLRFIPTTTVAERTPFRLQELAEEGPLIPFGGNPSCYMERNKYGAVVFVLPKEESPSNTTGFTQVFKSGEIWGVSATLSQMKRDGVSFIPSTGIEKDFEGGLTNYLRFARYVLALDVPLRFIAGLSDVEGFTMALPQGHFRFAGQVVEEEVVYKGIVNDHSASVHELLLPFFQQVWEACGLERPEGFRSQR
jgi:hypothetical protein